MTPENDNLKITPASPTFEELERKLLDSENMRKHWESKYSVLIARDVGELEHRGLALKLDWVALASELEILNGVPELNIRNSDKVLDFVNRLRFEALAHLETKSIEELVVITSAYETWYRASVATLQNRAVRIKIDKTREFEQTKKDLRQRDKDNAALKEELKEASRRRTPEEVMLEQLAKLLGSREAAVAQYAKMKAMVPNGK